MGESDNEDDKITVIVGRDRWTGMTIAHVVKGKGLVDDWIVRQLVNDIEAMGYVDIRLKADNENAIKVLLDRVK